MTREEKKSWLLVIAFIAVIVYALVSLTGCGMFESTGPWLEIGRSITQACAKCHAKQGGDLSPVMPPHGAPGPDGSDYHSRCPVDCPFEAGRN